MTLDKINTVYFLGIGGIGMSALARFFLLQGKEVYGYDLTPTELTTQLTAEGAHIHFLEDVNQIPQQVDVVVYTPAISSEHKEYQYFIEQKIPLLKRSETLGIICQNYPTVAIAGTHGKTTITAMVTQMLVRKGKGNLAVLSFIGGVAKNFNSNFVYDSNFEAVIAEADEFDRSFLTLHPQVAIITSIDADHLDVYKSHAHLKTSFQLFANQIQPAGTLIIYDEIAEQIEHPNKITYGFSENTNYRISDIQYFAMKTELDLIIHHHIITSSHHLIINIPGKHNALNAVAALAACHQFSSWKTGETDITHFIQKLSEFNGVKRRFDIRIQRKDLVYIDDYAHHPEEIKAFLDAVKKSYPKKKITGIFQPHLYSRTRDFVLEFADSLEILDEIILLDIYPAREKPIEGITSGYLLSIIKNKNKKLLKKEELVPYLQKNKLEILVTMGAGNIDKITTVLESKL
jgi:UDP-N-acetylmuramate--alanine ligase